MFFSSGNPLCILVQLYVVVLFARAISSWFPIRPDSPMVPVVRFLFTVTEPILAPVRRVIPPLGMFDMSIFVVVLVFQAVVPRLLGCR